MKNILINRGETIPNASYYLFDDISHKYIAFTSDGVRLCKFRFNQCPTIKALCHASGEQVYCEDDPVLSWNLQPKGEWKFTFESDNKKYYRPVFSA